jgi:hypothetical protein
MFDFPRVIVAKPVGQLTLIQGSVIPLSLAM